MKKNKFVGRCKEIQQLESVYEKKVASLVVVKGRRRIGKSRLIKEFSEKKNIFSFTGVPPENNITAQDQRNEFLRQFGVQFGIKNLKIDDWGDIFQLLAVRLQKEKGVLFLDEISWMGSKDKTFLGKLKIIWDTVLSHNSHLTLILCGSISSWIEKNILSSTGFFGRVDLTMTLQPLSLDESFQLMQNMGYKGSRYEALMYLSVVGGIPKYIEVMDMKESVLTNLSRLFFSPEGFFAIEFKKIFHDLFGRRNQTYKKIVNSIVTGQKSHSEIAKSIKYASSGPLSEYIEDLVQSGFVQSMEAWSFKNGQYQGITKYRLQDNYLRFYLKYIASKAKKIEKGLLQYTTVNEVPGFESVMGLQVENLVCNNRSILLKELGISGSQIMGEGPYYQASGAKRESCQIDYLIQTQYKTLYIVEVKFTNKLDMSVVNQVKRKIERLQVASNYACIPVLVHVGEISNTVLQSDYFAKIINLEDNL